MGCDINTIIKVHICFNEKRGMAEGFCENQKGRHVKTFWNHCSKTLRVIPILSHIYPYLIKFYKVKAINHN
jgi:hypothetical protein